MLGAAAYLAPLLGALLLLLMGRGQPSLGLLAAAVLIVGGAVVAGRAKPKGASPKTAPAASARHQRRKTSRTWPEPAGASNSAGRPFAGSGASSTIVSVSPSSR